MGVLACRLDSSRWAGEERELTLLVSAGDAFRAASARFIADHLSLIPVGGQAHLPEVQVKLSRLQRRQVLLPGQRRHPDFPVQQGEVVRDEPCRGSFNE